MRVDLICIRSIIPAWSCAATAQGCSSSEFRSFANVKSSVTFFMEHPGIIPSFFEKVVERAGDDASVAILKAYADDDLASPEKAKQALFLIRMAFSYPHIVEVCSNRQPRFTMLLLDRLRELNKEARSKLR